MLSGKLVKLRAIEMEDLDRYLAWINDPEVTRYIAMNAMYPASRLAEEEFVRGVAKRTGYDALTLAIDTLDEGRHIGSVALHDAAPSTRKAALGIMIGDKASWNRGYGTDAVLAILRFGFDEMNLHRVWLQVHDDNRRAIACYKKCGFVEEGRLRHDRYRGGEYHDTIEMGILEDEYRAAHG